MFICSICSKEFVVEFIYKIHYSKCKSGENIFTETIKGDVNDGGKILRDDKNEDDVIYELIDKELSLRRLESSGADFSDLLDKIKKHYNKSDDVLMKYIIHKINDLDLRIKTIEKSKNKVKNLPIPINDYMVWIKSLQITDNDKVKSFQNVFKVIKDILIRNNVKSAGIFYKWVCGKDNKTVKVLIGKKIIGTNMMIISYKWEYMSNKDLINIIDYFWNIFKSELINWYYQNESEISYHSSLINNDETNKKKKKGKCKGKQNEEKKEETKEEKKECIIDNKYNKYKVYYQNVMLISENYLIKELKSFVLDYILSS